MEIRGRCAVVIGGGSGLGRATAELLADRGAAVAILDLPGSQGPAVAERLGASFIPCDILDHEGAEQALNAAAAALGALHIGVNAAGGGAPPRRLIDADGPYPLEDFRRIVEFNLVASFNLSRIEAWHMSRNEPEDGERGVIVNMSSVSAYESQVGRIPYAASKAGVAGLSLGIARDLAPYGIRCMAIAPAMFDTGLLIPLSQDYRERLLEENVFPKRMGRPEEFAKLAVSIVDNPMLNGGTIRLDAATRRAVQDHLGDALWHGGN
jgi:NAD(P)-dependent dehydrogenase (short-subunit alcohol dehydrogenase family)